MKLIIDIPEENYNFVKKQVADGITNPLKICIANGTPLEKELKNQKTGHWEENAPEWQNVDPPYICSECGNFHLRKTNYCDQCGAKMGGE